MGRKLGFLSGVLILGFFSLLGAGCASSQNSLHSSALDTPTPQMFLSPAQDFESPAFLSRWSGRLSERDKIHYLLSRIAASRDQYFRNGAAHSGKAARRWFLYKSAHWVSGIQGAGDFIERCASFSMKTGRPYQVRLSDGKIYSLNSVLKNELRAFEKHNLRIRRELAQTASLSKPAPVPLSSSHPASAAAVPAA